MGNCFVNGSSSETKTAKLIDAVHGTLRQARVPAKAVELMLENPGHVVCFSDQIKLTGKVVPMRADDEVEGGKVYMLFPVGRSHRNVTEAETAILDVVLGKRRCRRRTGGAQVSPAAAVETAVAEKVEEEDEDEEVTVELGRGCRWRPALEPISEAL